MMIGVSGVGPKAALSTSVGRAAGPVLRCPSSQGDEKMLMQAPGIGKKNRVAHCFGLRDKMSREQLETASSVSPVVMAAASGRVNHTQEAVAALMVLRYSQAEALPGDGGDGRRADGSGGDHPPMPEKLVKQ